MAIVTPCRSDLSPAGLSPHSHLADGRIRLVLVRKCSQIDYLRFLTSIPKTGEPSFNGMRPPGDCCTCVNWDVPARPPALGECEERTCLACQGWRPVALRL